MKYISSADRTGNPEPRQPLLPRSNVGWILLCVCLVASAGLRIYEFRGFGATDDAAYAKIAHEVAAGRFVPGTYAGPAVFPLRMGIIYPTAILFKSVGVSEWTMVAFPFVLSILSVVLAFATASYFFGEGAGLIAASLWAFLPLDAFHASILVPDLAAAFFASTGVLIALVAGGSRVQRRSALFGAGLAVGLLFGVSWLCKESVAYLAPFCAVLLVMRGRRDPARHVALWAGVAAGSLAVLGGEMFCYYRTTGDWLFRVHETERNYRQFANAFFVEGSQLALSQSGYRAAVMKRLVLTGPLTIFPNSQLLYLPLVAVGSLLYAAYRRDRRYLLPGLWFVTLAFMFNFASSSLKSYVPLVLFDRYLYPVMLPAAIIVAGSFSELIGPAGRGGLPRPVWVAARLAGAVVVIYLLVAGTQRHFANRMFAPHWEDDLKTLSRSLTPSDRIYTDILAIHGLEFFWSYPDSMNTVNFEDMTPGSLPRSGEYVLINKRYLRWLVAKAGWWPTKSRDYQPPAFAKSVPSSWEKVWGNDDTSLYRARETADVAALTPMHP